MKDKLLLTEEQLVSLAEMAVEIIGKDKTELELSEFLALAFEDIAGLEDISDDQFNQLYSSIKTVVEGINCD
ncbi:hypothetical protein [Pseudoalteromonas pernae]|uniref:hypothetical protein n=1 Tax=Pseudoalteromonas pernae TaxID=3118054 RepID=UPI003242DF9F